MYMSIHHQIGLSDRHIILLTNRYFETQGAVGANPVSALRITNIRETDKYI